MKLRTSELIGPALDWAVAKAEGYEVALSEATRLVIIRRQNVVDYFDPSTNWGWGGPITEREHINTDWVGSEWSAKSWALLDGKVLQQTGYAYGLTPLVSAMRCFVASKLGDEVDVPEALLS